MSMLGANERFDTTGIVPHRGGFVNHSRAKFQNLTFFRVTVRRTGRAAARCGRLARLLTIIQHKNVPFFNCKCYNVTID